VQRKSIKYLQPINAMNNFIFLGMSTLRIASGLNKSLSLPDNQVVLIGRHKHIKSLTFENQLAEKLNGVDEKIFNAAIKQLQPDSSVPFYLDLAKLISVKDDVSRHNAPSNSVQIFKELSGLKLVSGVKNLSIVIYADYEHVFASVAAVARSFPVFNRKVKKEELESIQVELVVTDGKTLEENDLKFLQTLCDSMRDCARQVDTPCNEFNSEDFAADAIRLVDELNAGVTNIQIKGEDLLKQGFGGIYSVGKAARHPPIFLCFSHKPAGSIESYALVGKGIVYDTGGLSLKTPAIMPTMKLDMAGAAGLLGAFCTLVKSGFKEELHCILCIAENHISPDATKPDDIIKMLSGKFVEVNNTDAEGRLVLADGLFYAKNTLKAKTIIDMATLTGAQSFASGKLHSAILCNNDESEVQILEAGRKSGDLAHPLPYSPELHFADFKSKVADMKNSINDSREGPPSADAGLFIFSHVDFASDVNWIHVDMAYPAFIKDRATAYGVPLISALLSKHTDVNVAK